MDVLLKKDVERLGSKDEIVSVKNGYGRNFLIPKGVAILATSSVKKMHAETLKQRAHKDNKLIRSNCCISKTNQENLYCSC
jgi:large subunit ribosomal protein L9